MLCTEVLWRDQILALEDVAETFVAEQMGRDRGFAACSTRLMKVDLEPTIERVEQHYAAGDPPYAALIIDGLGKVGLPE